MANFPCLGRIKIFAAVLVLASLSIHAQASQVWAEGEAAPPRRCAWQYNSKEQAPFTLHQPDEEGENDGGAEEKGVQDGQPFVQCSKASNACYSLWHVDPAGNDTGAIVFNSQGCWEVSGNGLCNNSDCIADKKPPRAANNTKFCCCSGDFCNVKVLDMYKPEVETLVKAPVETPYLRRPSFELYLIVPVAILLLCVVLAAMFAAYRFYVSRSKHDKPPPDHPLEGGGAHQKYSVQHLHLANVVGQGRYGSVWKGNVRDQEVAVKIFPSHYRNYFLNERDIYCLPFMENPALLTYFGCDERVTADGSPEYLLVLTYAPNGCLQDYLRANTLDCATFCKMALGVAKGLAHLHTDVKKGDKSKPCVSHRDLNTRNILVKNDLTCCLCDLGFAMKIAGSKYFYNGEEQHAETKSINDVGTLRYMAPEVLEGAVNLRDCESSLKQIDVYALGLVLWELASRCADFYPGGVQQTPVYSLPFQAEVGHHPTFEQMQVLVSRHKARPLFAETWKDWTAVKLLKETVEDCWDQDAEARLTALCVEERLQELPALWDRKRATMYACGISPTVNPMQAPPVAMLRTTVNHMTETNLLIEDEDTAESAVKDMQESTASEGTVETMLTLSPSEPPPEPTYKISNHTAGGTYRPPASTLQQPYQGRNPCLERNLLCDDDTSSTGHLVDRSFKHATSHSVSHYNASPASDSRPTVQPNAAPIPYVQNVSATPKQPNVPGNGSAPRPQGRWSWGVGLRRLLDRRRFLRGDVERNDDEAKSNLLVDKSPTIVDTLVVAPTKNGKVMSVSVRPSTLPLARPDAPQVEMRSSRHSLDEQFFSTGHDASSRLLKDINGRVKTPGDVPPAVRKARGKRTAERLSLYDDRMMASGEFAYGNGVKSNEGKVLTGSSLVIALDKDSSSF